MQVKSPVGARISGISAILTRRRLRLDIAVGRRVSVLFTIFLP
jgi:hypothetical protein